MGVDSIVVGPQRTASKTPTLPQLPSIETITPVPSEDYRTNEHRGYESAIKVQNVCKKYEKNPVLADFNMTVPKGSIYALLGSSGCGKTTILSCVVGRQTWDTGTISVLGSPPHTTKFHIDSRKVGYMPQDLALQPRLTIWELLSLYGRLHGMSHEDISARFQFLQKFLQLPKDHKVIADLSGGQQRRASLAVALLHEPDLIILDEPTVGLDPLLRMSIWEHLQDLVTNLQVTIVLTTHYVDEARRSSMIGLMRHGRIIAEQSPSDLMKTYRSTSLDDIVLQICKRDAASSSPRARANAQILSEVVVSSSSPNPKKELHTRGRLAGIDQEEIAAEISEENRNIKDVKSSTSGAKSDGLTELSTFPSSFTKGLMGSVKARRKCVSSSFTAVRRVRGLIWATYMATFRHPAFIPLTFLLPAFTAAVVQFVFGSDLRDLKFGVVNDDDQYRNMNVTGLSLLDEQSEARCFDTQFSNLFLSKIPSESLTLIAYSNKSDALHAVHEGKIWGFVNIPANYTAYMQQRMALRRFSDGETLDGTIIGMHLDMSSYLGSLLILKKLSAAYESYLQELASSCGLPAQEFELPLRYEKPVYGNADGTYGDHVVPGLILVIIFVLPLGACSVSVIQERNQGSMGRMRVSGMANWDIIVTYYVTHGSFQVVQTTLCTLVLVFGFSYVIRGPILLYVILNACNCFCGLAIGFFLGLVCSTELHSLIVVFFLASILIPFSGAFWPIECLQPYWRMVAYSLPTTLTAQTWRSVVFRGLSYTHFLVWPGLVVPLIWMSVFLVLSLVMLRRY